MNRSSFCSAVLALCLAICNVARSADDANTAARAYLAAKGLVPVGTTWIIPHELQLRKRLDALDPLDKRHQAARQAAEAVLVKNEQIRIQLAAAEREAARKNPAAQPSTPPPGKLHSSLPDVTGLGELTPLQGAMIELVGARSALTLAVLAAGRDLTQMEQEYRKLQGDEQVAAALKDLGRNHRLGPAKSYDPDSQRVGFLAEQVLSSTVPVYWESQRFRVGVILDQRTPATFSYAVNSEPVLITTSLAQVLGLSADDSLPRQTHRVGNRVVSVAQIKLPRLRIGKHVFTDVPALLLPPDAEDLGCQLGVSALGGVRMELSPRTMALTVAQ